MIPKLIFEQALISALAPFAEAEHESLNVDRYRSDNRDEYRRDPFKLRPEKVSQPD